MFAPNGIFPNARRMSNKVRSGARGLPLSFWLLAVFLVVLGIAGGASRADVAGQVIVRLTAWIVLIIHVLTAADLSLRTVKGPIVLVAGMAVIAAIQLIPLPPAIWTALPGRQMFVSAASAIGAPQPWRPLSISPGATVNALSSLIVPVTILVLAAGLTRDQHWRIVAIIIAMAGMGGLLALAEFAGGNYDLPFVNDFPGAVSGNMANRNHFALFAAQGMVLSMIWGFRGAVQRWKMLTALGLILFFALIILASGSRSGVFVGLFALVLGALAIRDSLGGLLARVRLRTAAIVGGLLFVAMAGAIVTAIQFGRADAIERAVDLSSSDDLRASVWPVVVGMVGNYFPAGAGFGTFDQAFRISEPHAMLAAQYVNHAHNDWLEIVLDGGALGLIWLAVCLVWFINRSRIAWRRGDKSQSRNSVWLARAGSALVLLALIASVPDYPVRTPLMMALVALAAVWLDEAKTMVRRAGLQTTRDG